MFVLTAGKGCDLSCHSSLFVCHVVKAAHQVHAAAIVEQQWLVIMPATVNNAEWQTASTQNPVGANVEKCQAVLAYDEQLFFIVHALQVKWLVNIIYRHDLCLVIFDNNQMPGIAYGVAFTVFCSKYIAKTVLLVTNKPVCNYTATLYLVGENFPIGAHCNYFVMARQDADA